MMTTINLNLAKFKILPYGGTHAIVVKYGDKKFVAQSGAITELRPNFVAIVKNRSLLLPFLQRVLGAPAQQEQPSALESAANNLEYPPASHGPSDDDVPPIGQEVSFRDEDLPFTPSNDEIHYEASLA